MVYLDNSSTTMPYSEVIETFSKVSRNYFANPSSLHPLGKEAEQLMIQARKKIANLLKVQMKEIIFTSGGTEGNNLAIKGTAYKLKSRGNHIITSSTEHSSIYEACKQLEKEGFSITYLRPNEDGQVTWEQIKTSITSKTILVSLIHVNNEIGSIQPIEEIGKNIAKHPKIIFHVDDVQGITKVPIHLEYRHIDLCTMSAHKFHGLKGTGILFIRKGIDMTPLFSGGDHERGFRAGTENLAGIVSMAKALRLAMENANKKLGTMRELSEWLEKECSMIEGVKINSPKDRAPHIVNLSIRGLKPEVVVQALAEKNVYVSTKSACSSKRSEPSRVLIGLGYDADGWRATNAIRLSFSFDNTMEDAVYFLKVFKEIVSSMKRVVKL